LSNPPAWLVAYLRTKQAQFNRKDAFMRLRTIAAVVLLGASGLLAGCASDGSMKKSDHGMMHEKAAMADVKSNSVVITGAHGGTATFVYDASTGKPKMASMTGDMKECPDCMKAVDGYYAGGKLPSECKACKSKLAVAPAPKGAHGGM
jgi:hypothetical protein